MQKSIEKRGETLLDPDQPSKPHVASRCARHWIDTRLVRARNFNHEQDSALLHALFVDETKSKLTHGQFKWMMADKGFAPKDYRRTRWVYMVGLKPCS